MNLISLLIIASLVSAGIGLAGSAIDADAQKKANEANLEAVDKTNEANLALAREDREFQLEMANTAHQREVADLKAAGLNPVLSANGGSGAAVVSSNTANQQAGRVSPVGFDLSPVSNALQSLTNLMLVSKLAGSTGFRRGYLGLNSAGMSRFLGQLR